MTAQGFAITFAVAGIQLVWFCLGMFGLLQPYVAFDFMAATCALAVWLLPNFTPVQPEPLPGKND
jgi:hypothetical protein